MTARTLLTGGLALTLLAAACGGPDEVADDGRVQVVVGFYPLEYLAERVGGDRVQVSSLAQPGAEPHDLELRPQQIQEMAEADLVLYLGSFQPAVDDAVAENAPEHSLDVLGATEAVDGYTELGADEEAGLDPHVWLDPTAYADLAEAVADRMAEADPEHADAYAANGAALVADLTALDEEFSTGLADCERSEIVTTHNAFGYLALRYGLEQVAIAGLSPEDEPSPQDVDSARSFAEQNGVTTIFYEEAVSPEYAETVADQVGADTAVLSPLEVVDEGEDYLSAMRRNLGALTEALGCP